MPERREHVDRRAVGGSSVVGWVGRAGAPVVAALVYLLIPEGGVSESGRACAAVGSAMAVLWMTEALPLAATALLPLALFAPLGVASMEEAAAPYANPLIFLFMGGFLIALAMERWGLHRRIALTTLLLSGSRLTTLVGAFMVAAAGLSMWVSNTATAVMMLPIGVSVAGLLPAGHARAGAFGPCLLLGLAYACSIGGVATLIGTPPNVALAGYVREAYGFELGFGRWMLFGLPLSAVFLVIAWWLLTRVLCPVTGGELPGGRAMIRAELARLGPMGAGERLTLGVFALAAFLWVFRELLTGVAPWLAGLNDAQIAVSAGLLLFALPVRPREGVFVLDWATASRLPWDVLLLFGGGLSLAAAIGSTGLDAAIGSGLSGLAGAPVWLVVLAVSALLVFLTELTSNTATALAFLPVLGGAAEGLGVDPLVLLIPAAFATSCAFMLPVATPPNAIVFGSGRVRMSEMVRAGAALNVVSIVLATAAAVWLVPAVFGTIGSR